ncbi:MAG TPA: peptidylprolyl isomerase [Ignavibacteriales bacterium]|nr:peptidylprolyl isomerase [Ignavibacteriales bacterium]
MAMMAKMRSLAPAFIITIGGIFVLFMVLSDSNVMSILGQGKNNVGSVNGEDITYQQFSTYLDQARQRQKEQTGKDIDEDQMDAFNDQVWDALVTQDLVKEQYDKLGIKVSDQEVQDILLGPNPPEALRRQFTDSTGRFNRQLYETTLRAQKKEVLLGLEENIRQMRLQEKLQNYLFASLTVSEGEIKRRFIDQTTKINANYVFVDLNTIPDNSVSVNEDDLKKFYNENQDRFKVDAQRKLRYVLFSKAPSKEDSAAIKDNLVALVNKAKNDTADFKSYVQIYSEAPATKDTLTPNMLPPDAVDAFANAAPGSIIGPYATYEGYVVYKVLAKIPSNDTYVRASHILIPFKGDEAKAQQEANDIYNQLQAGADFSKMAREKSDDVASARKGGDLGWFGKGQMVKEFEDAAFNGPVGVVQKPFKSNFGYHIVKVTGKTSNKYVVERIVNKIKASASTADNAYQAANDFVYLVKKSSFDQEAKTMNYRIMETPLFNQDATYVPGIGANKTMVDWAFDSDKGDLSDVYKAQNGYVVAQVEEVVKPGVKKFEEVKASLKPMVIREKKLEKASQIAEKIKQQASGSSLQQAALNFGGQAKFDTTGTFTPAQTVPGVGRDFAFIQKALTADVNKITDPVKGQRGVYLIQVTSRTPFQQSQFAMQRNSVRDALLQQKKSYFFSQWINQLKKDAKIVDNRRQFYAR